MDHYFLSGFFKLNHQYHYPSYHELPCLSLLRRCRVEGAILQLRHAGGIAVALPRTDPWTCKGWV